LGIISVCLVGALISLDTAAVFQLLISQPIVACTFIGWLSNDLTMGMQIGLIMQLIWISTLPVGAVVFPNGNVGSLIAAIVAIKLNASVDGFSHLIIFLCVVLGLLFSFIGAHAMRFVRMSNVFTLNRVLKQIAKYRFNSVQFSIVWALLFNFLILFLVIITGVFSGQFVFQEIINRASYSWNEYARFTEIAVLGAGAGLTLTMYKDRKSYLILAAGIILYVIVGIFIF